MSRQRLPELDLAKGLAIFLVVLGHLGSNAMPAGNAWFERLTAFIYEFHMPFFVLLSGAVFQVTFKPEGGARNVNRYVMGRAARLLPAFFMFAVTIWAAKTLAAQILYVDNVRSGGWEELLRILIRPGESVAKSLWYIYVLFQYCVLTAVVVTMSQGRLLPLVIVATLLSVAFHLMDVTTLFAADLLCELAIFFALGCVFGKYYGPLSAFVKSNSIIFYCIFASSFVVTLFLNFPTTRTVIGLCSLPALFAFASSFSAERDQRILLTLSQYTFTIYLMNTAFIGLFKGVMLEVVPWDGLNFLFFFPVLLAAGLLGPIAVHSLVLSKLPVLGKLTK